MSTLKRSFKANSIRLKLTLAIVTVSIFVLALSSAFMTYQAVHDKRKNLIHSLRMIAQVIGDNSMIALSQDDQDAVAEKLLALFTDSAISMGCVYNQKLELFAEYALYREHGKGCPLQMGLEHMPPGIGKSVSGNYIAAIQEVTSQFYPDYVAIWYPMVMEGDTIGILYLRSDLSSIHEFVEHQIRSTVIFMGMAVVLVVLLTLWMQRFISRPILNLTKVAREISDSHNYTLRAVKETGDELGFLAESFNNMLDMVEKRTRELQISESIAIWSKEAAEKANNAKSDFLINMSHELRTPMNSIMGLTRILMEEEGVEEEHKSLLNIVFLSSTAMMEIINDILDLSNIESGKIVLEKEAFSFHKVSQALIETLKPAASQKGIYLNYSYKKKEWPYLSGDSARVGRILSNIISNGIKYTARGSVNVIFDYFTLPDGRIELQCEIRDTGIGINKDKLDYIFEKFAQADESINRKFGGTGVGLTISKELAEMMGGKIAVSSIVDVGSIFVVTIPFEVAESLEDKAAEDNQKIIYEEHRIPVEQARILVAEDYELNQIFIRKLLQRMKVPVFDLARNGVEAVSKYEEGWYDLILMDCHMPEKNGYQATREIRVYEQSRKKNRIPIIAMTADAMAGAREKCIQSGMDEYVTKPVAEEKLNRTLSRWLIFPAESLAPALPSKGKDIIESENPPPVDMDLIDSYACGDAEAKQDFVHVFLKQSKEGLAILAENCVNGESQTWHEVAHKLKGGAATFGAERMRHLCAQAQEMKTANIEQRKDILLKMEGAFSEVEQFLNEHIRPEHNNMTLQ